MSEADDAVVGGVVLAAGESSRFGTANKLLASVEGSPIVAHVARIARASAVDDAVAVVGYDADAVTAALAPFDLPTRRNGDYAAGQSTSVREGVRFARESDWDAAAFLLGDMPFVRAETVDRLVAAYRAGDGDIVAPRFEGRRGNPVLFDRRHFEALADVDGDRGGRALLAECDGTRFVDVDDPGVRRDVDSEADLRAYADANANAGVD